MIGAVLAEAPEAEVKRMERVAGLVGMAFQIRDDILDVTSTREELGKPVFSDEKNEKTTYVTWKGLEEAEEAVEEISARAIRELKTAQGENPYLEELLNKLVYRTF